jgi:hypothetical protein
MALVLLLIFNALVEVQASASIIPASGYFGVKTRGYIAAH